MNKKELSERDICTKFITPALRTAGWDEQTQLRLALYQPSFAEYLLRALKGLAPLMLERVPRSSHGTCRLAGRDYSNFPIPIPPVAEQIRIVAKIDQVLALCDRLEAAIDAGEIASSHLLDALLHQALASPHHELANQTGG